MVCASLDLPANAGDSAIVLRARILDAVDRPIRATNVVAVECTVWDVDSRFLVARIEVGTRDVILPSLIRDRLWTVDDVGYNFRHDLAGVAELASFAIPDFGGRVEVRYTFVLIDCTRETVSFCLKLV